MFLFLLVYLSQFVDIEGRTEEIMKACSDSSERTVEKGALLLQKDLAVLCS